MKRYTPKPKIVTRWAIGTFFCQSAIALWIIETAYFLFRDGWHWKAIHADEKLWDSIVSIIWMIGLAYFAILLVDVVHAHVMAAKKQWERNERDAHMEKRGEDYAKEQEDDMRDNNMGERI